MGHNADAILENKNAHDHTISSLRFLADARGSRLPITSSKHGGPDWLAALLKLPAHGHPDPAPFHGLNLAVDQAWYGKNERALDPPIALLSWLVRNLGGPAVAMALRKTREAAGRTVKS